MKLYPIVRPLLFKLDPEFTHTLTLETLCIAEKCRLLKTPFLKPTPDLPIKVMGLSFPNPIGLAAGLDKNGDYIGALGNLGFGFLEIGTITPRQQPGNSKPRLFRLPESASIINRMGFNNKGVDHLITRIKQAQYPGILGINIGKNFDTPLSEASNDYLECLDKVYACADYVTINISSPNTKDLRKLQNQNAIRPLLVALKQKQQILHEINEKYVPLVVKIAPDLQDFEIEQLAMELLEQQIDGVIATNTTLSRTTVSGQKFADEHGGLSGAPLTIQATHVVRQLAQHLDGKIPIIAAGGCMTARDVVTKIKAGASLVQLYSGLIYSGPELISQSVAALAAESSE